MRRTPRALLAAALLPAALLGALPCRPTPWSAATAEEAPTTPAAAATPDAFAAALADLRLSPADLGYRAKGTWSRYPRPSTVPHVLPFFEDLLAEPLATYEAARTLGNAVEDLLTPEALTAPPAGEDRRETAFKLAVTLGTDRRIGGFRGYSANLDPRPEADDPLRRALLVLLERSGGRGPAPMAFGQPPAGEAADPAGGLSAAVQAVPAALHLPLARLVLDLVEARAWIDRGLRHVSAAQRAEVFALLPTLTEDTPDGTRYHPVLDDVARVLDEHSLHYGALKALQAVQDARRGLEQARAGAGVVAGPPFRLALSTPWGLVHVSSAPGDEDLSDPFLVVTFGARPLRAPLGATSASRPLSVALLMDGATGVRDDGPAASAGAGLARGVLGCGLVWSAGASKTAWSARRWGLGAGLFGLGALVDEGGDDVYEARSAAMGAAFFGAGLLLEAAGDDVYRLLEGDGQGFGGPGGIGVLADRSGDDAYESEPDAAKAGRADYHSAHKVAVSNAQGVGSGRRGDGSDGHAWAGGLGALIDVDGDDRYHAGNFSQGLGYWYGTGLLWDGGGDDAYTSVYFTQGSGAHFAVGALIDESGDDVHVLRENAGAAYGFGWDVVNALLLDRGHGNDRYEARIISTGLAMVRSNAFFLDEGGDDRYVLDVGAQGLGDVDRRPEYLTPGRTTTFPFHLGQVGVFLDLGGVDVYERRGPDGATAPDPAARDGATWRLEARDPAAAHGFNVALGRDLERGRLGFLDAWPARVPAKAPAAGR